MNDYMHRCKRIRTDEPMDKTRERIHRYVNRWMKTRQTTDNKSTVDGYRDAYSKKAEEQLMICTAVNRRNKKIQRQIGLAKYTMNKVT